MNTVIMRRLGVSLTAAAVLTGITGCQGGSDKAGGGAGGGQQPMAAQAPAKVLTAAFKKTKAAKSAKIHMTMSPPTGTDSGGDMEMTGVLGWQPTVMDVTMTGSALAKNPESPQKLRMVWVDNVMYMDMGAKAAKDMQGKRWMKLDLVKIAKKSGNEQAMRQMTGGMENANQDPAQQLAVLLDSPKLKHVGSATVDGVPTEHYKGTVTVEEMMANNKSLDVLSKKDREQFLANMKKAGITGYDTEVWVNEDRYPVKMDIGMDSAQGVTKISTTYSDYGAKATVKAPPASETFDLFEMMQGLQGSGAGSGR
jgi:hypothetical protein